MKLKPYPEYKDSGVEWLGEIPEGWGLLRLKHGVDLINQKVDGLDAEFPYTGLEHIESWTGRRIEHEEAPSNEGQANSFKTGDVLFGKLRPYLAKALAAECDGVCTGELLVFRPKAVQQRLLLYFMLSRDVIWLVDSSTYGAKMPRANWDFIGDIRVPIPEPSAQRAIAAFLDRETARIDALVAKKERQIELLKEKRSALISHAVTKGLDPNAKMKESGVEWLGEIPEGWEVCLFKRVSETSYGVGGELDRSIESGTPILSMPNVSIDGTFSLDEVPYTELSESEKERYLLRKGDLIFNWRNGSSAHLAKTAYFDLEGEYTHVSFLLRLRFDTKENDSRFFYYLINGLRATGFFASSKAGVNNTFNQSELDNLWIISPPKESQKLIADFLDRETAQIDVLASKITQSIAKLREYRTALISAAVTGKIDVRGEAISPNHQEDTSVTGH